MVDFSLWVNKKGAIRHNTSTKLHNIACLHIVDGLAFGFHKLGDEMTLAGTASTSPTKPTLPAIHLELAYIFVRGGVSEIQSYDIGAEFAVQRPTTFEFALSGTLITDDYFFEWCADGAGCGYPNPECWVTVRVKDQYGQYLNPGAGGYKLTLSITTGTGQVYSGDSGWNDSSVSQTFYNYWYNFKYRRKEDETEQSVVLHAELQTPEASYSTQIILLDASDEIIGY